MKKVFILMLGLVAGTASFASAPHTTADYTRLVMTSGHKIKLFVQPIHAKGQLTIRDANGQAVYNSTVALQKGLNQQFDFAGLGTGTYRLTLTTDTETVTKTFVIQANPNASFIVQES